MEGILPWIVWVLGLGASPGVLGAWWLARWRKRRRNKTGKCAQCGKAWKELGEPQPFMVEGIEVCEGCAEILRRRLQRALAAVGGLALVGFGLVGFDVVRYIIFTGQLPRVIPYLFAITPPVMCLATAKALMRRMKDHNVRALSEPMTGPLLSVPPKDEEGVLHAGALTNTREAPEAPHETSGTGP